MATVVLLTVKALSPSSGTGIIAFAFRLLYMKYGTKNVVVLPSFSTLVHRRSFVCLFRKTIGSNTCGRLLPVRVHSRLLSGQVSTLYILTI